jgi:glutamate dehydrogenase
VAEHAAEQSEEGAEVAAFLEWARNEGFEVHRLRLLPGEAGARELERDIPSRIGVLQDTSHPVYGSCLANIPGDFETLSHRGHTLSIVKADVSGTLHRDQPLDFIGVRNTDEQGNVLGEHCFVGLFTRAANLTPLARLPFARGRVAKVLKIAGVRQEGFRAEKFVEILESLPRTEALEADPQWLAEVCGSVVSLYKQPRTKVFARRDVYGRHLNVLVYLPRERYSPSVANALSRALKESSGASDVSTQTLVADGPLARVYLIARAARNPLDLETDIQRPLLSMLDGWHTGFSELADAVRDEPPATPAPPVLHAAGQLRQHHFAGGRLPRPGQDPAQRRRIPCRSARRERRRAHRPPCIYSVDKVPSLSALLPALHNAGVSIDREQAHSIRTADGKRHYVTSLTVDAASAEKLDQS